MTIEYMERKPTIVDDVSMRDPDDRLPELALALIDQLHQLDTLDPELRKRVVSNLSPQLEELR